MSLPNSLKKNFCVLPFNSLSIAPFGSVRVCCNNYHLPTDEAGQQIGYQFRNLDPLEAVNNAFHKELRRDMLEGRRHPSCHRCWDIEDQGGHSYRQGWNHRFEGEIEKYFENTTPDGSLKSFMGHYVEITLGNNCNLKCRMCNPFSSSSWIPEAEALSLFSPEQLEPLKKIDWFKKPEFREVFRKIVQQTDRLNFLGGEPLYNREHTEILKMCVEMGVASRIEIQYNTNLTVLPPEVLNLWNEFKFVFLNVSCDGYREVYEYVRYPAQWTLFENNLRKVCLATDSKKVGISIHATFQALNVTELRPLFDWVYDNPLRERVVRIPFVIYVNYPTYLDPKVLPREVREKAHRELKSFIEKVDSSALSAMENAWLGNMNSQVENLLLDFPAEVQSTLWHEFQTKTRALDQLRKQSVRKAIPGLKSFFA